MYGVGGLSFSYNKQNFLLQSGSYSKGSGFFVMNKCGVSSVRSEYEAGFRNFITPHGKLDLSLTLWGAAEGSEGFEAGAQIKS